MLTGRESEVRIFALWITADPGEPVGNIWQERAPPKQAGDPFEDKLKEIAERLPREKLKRLIDILQQYQGTPPGHLRADILRELNELIDIGEGRSSSREETILRQRDTATSPPPIDFLNMPSVDLSVSESDNYFTRMSDSEKLRMVEQVLNLPECPIPKEVIPNLPDEMKVDLFEKLVKDSVIRWEKAGGQ